MFKKSILSLLGLFAVVNTQSSYAEKQELIKIRADEWCPYNCQPGSNDPGYMIEVLQMTFGKKNIDYQTMNWSRAILETRKNKYDGIVGASIENAPDFIFSVPVGESKNCFYKKNTSQFKYTGIDSLNSVQLGVIKDYTYFNELEVYIKKNIRDKKKLDEHYGNNAQDRLILKLELGRLDTFVEDPSVVSYMMKKHPDIKDIVDAGCVKTGSLYIAFSPNNPKSKDRKNRLTHTIAKMIKSGDMDKLLAKYGAKPWYK
ncbi:MAG: transporter substrate-binding domain-containing protein [Bdellovibrionota bacterium]